MRELRSLFSSINYDEHSSRSSRGSVNNSHKRDVMKNLLREWKCDIVCFQESKLDSTSSSLVKSL